MSVFTSGVNLYDQSAGTISGYDLVYASGSSVTAPNLAVAVSGFNQAAGSTISLDFLHHVGLITLTCTGTTVAFTGSNYSPGHSISVRIFPALSGNGVTFSPGWSFVGSAAPTGIISGKMGLLTVQCFDYSDSGCVAAYSAKP